MISKVLIIVLQVSLVIAVPLQYPLLQPLQGTLQQQRLALQEQMLAIQQFQAMQRFNPVPPPMAMNPQQPLLLLFPKTPSNTELEDPYSKPKDNLAKRKPPQELEDEDDDSITIDAEPQGTIETNAKNSPMRAILLVPNNARFFLGDFISSLPFLPIEVNVPDSISWIYNGISGIISGIGQSWPFSRPQSSEDQGEDSMKSSVWKKWKTRNLAPIAVMPLGQPIVPMQV